ncbi:MAG TPA: rhomboid family intramembrane serine protease [Enhygromyxa sp.]|nr:rhomboid family intramembrane serine protease [Enhygromyxa sp.]
MQIELFDHLLLLAAIVCAATLVRLLRRSEGIGRGYALIVGSGLVVSVLAMGGDRFFGVLALALVVLTVIVPWLLEHGSRFAFSRGRLIWVARMSSLRASLMPGSGLGRQLPILEGLSLLERKGVDAALAHFRRLADEADDAAELAVIHEQIVAMLFHGQRWDEGIAHYERRFHPGYAALRPSLALSLLRAYGESGRLDTAAGLLRALEEGPIGGDPGTAELLGQARLTFLAYAGAVEPVDEIVKRQRFAELGLTAATAELFKGIALARAGEPKQAVETLSRVEDLAGPRDHRVLEAARSLLDGVRRALPSEGLLAVPEIGPELRGYVELVGDRLRAFVIAAPTVRTQTRPWMTYAVMFTLSLVYGVHLLRGGGSLGLLELGAMSEDLWRAGTAGSWGRVFTSAWIHVDLVGLLFDVYAIWLAGQVVERMLGAARMACATVLAAFAGVAASVMALPLLWDLGLDGLAIVAPTGGNLMAIGAIAAALWLLTPRRTPLLAARSRRNLVVTLTLLLVANLLTSWPGLIGSSVAPVALLVTMLVATLSVVAFPVDAPRWVRRSLGAVVGAVLLTNVVALVLVIVEDPEAYLVDHRAQRCELGGVVVRTPIGTTPMSLDRDVPFELPIVDGLLDTLELRDGSLVQLAVHRGPVTDDQPALFELLEGLDDEISATASGPLPEAFAERIAASPGSFAAAGTQPRWRAWDLWRAGYRIGRVIEHRLPDVADAEPATVMLLATPPEAIDHAPAVYAAILREAAIDPEASERPRCQVD